MRFTLMAMNTVIPDDMKVFSPHQVIGKIRKKPTRAKNDYSWYFPEFIGVTRSATLSWSHSIRR